MRLTWAHAERLETVPEGGIVALHHLAGFQIARCRTFHTAHWRGQGGNPMGLLETLIEAVKRGDLAEVTSILEGHPELVHQRDQDGATALHYAAFEGHRPIAIKLIERGADVNAADDRFGATPAGWAIEYLREMGGFLGIELSDFAYAIERGDAEWVARFLRRFPALRAASDGQGLSFKLLAEQSRNQEVAKLFEP